MKGFDDFQFDPEKLEAECLALNQLLNKAKGIELSEKYDLAPVVTASKNLLATMAMTYGGVAKPNLWASELWVHDKLRCDYAYGDSRTRRYCFIEIEDAREASVFIQKRFEKSGTGQPTNYSEWAPRFDHGTSQLLDWIRLIQDHHQTDDFIDQFGEHNGFQATFILIIGRDGFLSPSQKKRLAWRSKNVITSGYKVQAFTFDELLDEGHYQLGLQKTENPYDPGSEAAENLQAYKDVAAMLGIAPNDLKKITSEWVASKNSALDAGGLAERIKVVSGKPDSS